jgi:hypothetical protein
MRAIVRPESPSIQLGFDAVKRRASRPAVQNFGIADGMRRAVRPLVGSTIDLSISDVSLTDLSPQTPMPTLRISFSELRRIAFPEGLTPLQVRPARLARPPLSAAAAALLAPPPAGVTMPWAVERRRGGSGWRIALCTILAFAISTVVMFNSRLAEDPAVRPYAEAASRSADRAWLEARKQVANAIAAARATDL